MRPLESVTTFPFQVQVLSQLQPEHSESTFVSKRDEKTKCPVGEDTELIVIEVTVFLSDIFLRLFI